LADNPHCGFGNGAERQVWQAAWPWLAVIAVCGTYSHFCMTHALRHADATTVVPIDFLRVPLTALAAWLVFGERFDVFTVLGAAVILGGNLLNLKRGAGPAPVEKGPGASSI
jgi:drug/metabolite transporter (DMT)-like permease